MSQPPLADIRVLDISTFLAAPFCGTILADFGAEVIKIEQPNGGDPLRRFGTPTECGDTLVWLSEARNKKTMTLDLRMPKGAEIFLKLVETSDIVLENFRPGTLERWGIGPDRIHEANPRCVILRVSGYGQTGPYRDKVGLARIAHAFGGLSNLSGEKGRIPVVPGSTSIADYMSGLWGAVGVLLALSVAKETGRGQVVDIALYESVFRVLDELVPAYGKYGHVRERMGAEVEFVVPHGHWMSSDGQWLAIACSSDRLFARLAELMGKPEIAAADVLGTMDKRIERRAEVNAMVADWVGARTAAEVVEACSKVGVPCGLLLDIRQIFEDPQYAARGNIETVDDPRVGPLALPAAVPRLSETPARLRHAGRALGEDTDEILTGRLNLTPEEIARLRKVGAV